MVNPWIVLSTFSNHYNRFRSATVKDGFNFHANCTCTEVMYTKRARKERSYWGFNNFGNSEEDVAEFLKVHKWIFTVECMGSYLIINCDIIMKPSAQKSLLRM